MYDYDLLIIGAGPAGIFTALEMNRLAPEKKVLVVDSGSSIDHRLARPAPVGNAPTARHAAS